MKKIVWGVVLGLGGLGIAACSGGGSGSGGSSSGGVPDGGPGSDAGVDASIDAGPIVLSGPIDSLALGGRHSCAVYASGAMTCWGGNDNAQLGLGDHEDRGGKPGEVAASKAIDLGADARVVEAAAGDRHTCARLANGKVKCWGGSDLGQLGLGTKDERGDVPGEMGDALPALDLGTSRVTQITAGQAHTCARFETGALKCWGRNANGQLGLGDSKNRGETTSDMAALPNVDLGTGRTAVEVRAGENFTCARLDDGSVRCWGENSFGQLGIGTTAAHGNHASDMGANLAAVSLGTGRTATALFVGRKHACAKLDDESTKCWGANTAGQLGLGDTQNRGTAGGQLGDTLGALDFGNGKRPSAMGLGLDFGCARLDDGTAKCWGESQSGQTGSGKTASIGDAAGEMGAALPPVEVGAGRSVAKLYAGASHVCVILDDAKVRCWGQNVSGQLGVGNRNPIGSAPNQMGDALPIVPLP